MRHKFLQNLNQYSTPSPTSIPTTHSHPSPPSSVKDVNFSPASDEDLKKLPNDEDTDHLPVIATKKEEVPITINHNNSNNNNNYNNNNDDDIEAEHFDFDSEEEEKEEINNMHNYNSQPQYTINDHNNRNNNNNNNYSIEQYLEDSSPSSDEDGNNNLHTKQFKRRIHRYYVITDKQIGQGAFAEVRLGVNRLTGEQVAIKIVEKLNIGDRGEDQIYAEVHFLDNHKHFNIVQMLDFFEDQNAYYLILEYVAGGEVFDFVMSNGKLREEEARHIFRQIILGVEYCHQNHVVHRDLKLENVLLDLEGNVKIIDFNFCFNVAEHASKSLLALPNMNSTSTNNSTSISVSCNSNLTGNNTSTCTVVTSSTTTTTSCSNGKSNNNCLAKGKKTNTRR